MAHIVPLSHAKDMGQCFLRFDYFIALGKPIKFQERVIFQEMLYKNYKRNFRNIRIKKKRSKNLPTKTLIKQKKYHRKGEFIQPKALVLMKIIYYFPFTA